MAVLATASPASAENLPKTDPQTWSTDGWLAFRFGMGPGDVYAVLRDPGSEMQARTEWFEGTVFPGFSHRYMVAETTCTLLGSPVSPSFTFAHGRLVEVFVMQDINLQRGKPADQSIAEGRAWARKLLLKFTEEYGPPEELQHEWRWMAGPMRIRVTTIGGLSFIDARAYDAAEEDGNAAQAAQLRDVEAGRLTSTPEKTWARTGWGRLRWGMGPADVAKRVAPSRLVPDGKASDRNTLYVQADLGDTLYGRYLRLSLRFERGRLAGLHLTDQHAATASGQAMHEWLAKIEDGLRKKYGAGNCDDYEGFHSCRWTAKNGADIMASGTPIDGRYHVGLFYEDARKSATDSQRERAELNKL